jgi:hypothetical protein
MKAKFILFLLVVCLSPQILFASTYYVSSAGNDANEGTSQSTAWKTIARVNKTRFQPGDKILFEGSSTFSGGIYLRASTAGTSSKPIIFSSFGKGTATITSGDSYGFYAYNTAGIELRRLSFAGSGRLSNTNSGIIFYTDSLNTHLQYLRLDSVEASGYRASGINIGSWKGTSGYADVRITNSQAHDNGEAGISSYAESLKAHSNWYIADTKAYNNSGRADITTTHTGNGIVVSGINGVLIERCEAYNNGWLNANPSGGPVGIWGWCCNNLVIQNSESHHNRSGLAHDGGGFDIDGGCTNSTMQYNYSHDNDGAGYLIAQYPGAPPLTDVIIRYNISENDARRYGQGAIAVWSSGSNGGIQRAAIYNNIVYLTPTTVENTAQPKAVYLSSNGISAVTFRNNIFQTTGGIELVSAPYATGALFQGNCYWSSEATFKIKWGSTTYSSLAGWQAATTQEKLNTVLCGVSEDPKLVLPGTSFGTSSLRSSLTTSDTEPYQLQPTSTLTGKGLNLIKEFGWSIGTRDFFGNATPLVDQPVNIGAWEGKILVSSPPLPVELTHWQAALCPTGVMLTWNTASERNSSHFQIERALSTSPDQFVALGRVEAAGNSTQVLAYKFTDAAPIGTTVFYRLRQVDRDGKESLSSVQVAKIGSRTKAAISVYPNPAREMVQVACNQSTGSTVALRLYSIQGKMCRSQIFSPQMQMTNSLKLPVADLPAGHYMLQVQEGTNSHWQPIIITTGR